MIWYEVVRYSGKIRPIEVLRSTDSSVWIPRGGSSKERREGIETDWSSKFPDYPSAFGYAMNSLKQKLHNAKRAVSELEQRIAKLKEKAPQQNGAPPENGTEPAPEPTPEVNEK